MKKIIYLFLVLNLISCKKEKITKPKNLISKDKMVTLLFDMHIANRNRNIKNIFDEKKPNYYPVIYKKYHIDSTQFYESHAYYMEALTEYQEIYKKLKDSVETLLKREEKIQKEKDSLNKLKRDKNSKEKKKLKTFKKFKKAPLKKS